MLTSPQESPAPPSSSRLARLAPLPRDARRLRVLDFDIENRPLSYWYEGRTTAEVTAIAAGWADQQKVHVWLLGRDSPEEMLRGFCALYEKADVVTAHNVRSHDLPIVCAALAELEMPLLGEKLASDTLRDIPRWKDLPKSQENLCEMLGIKAEKKHMSQISWREANRLDDAGLRKTHKRVVGDVIQHRLLRERLLELGWLKVPRMWKGGR